MLLSAGHWSDYPGAKALLSSLHQAKVLIADRGYDAGLLRWALADRDIEPYIPSEKGRMVPIPHNAALLRQRHRIENIFARLRNRRRITTRYDRCAKVLLSACAFVATILFWL